MDKNLHTYFFFPEIYLNVVSFTDDKCDGQVWEVAYRSSLLNYVINVSFFKRH